MSSTVRKRSEGDVYHLIVRGVGQQIIFEDDADRMRFMASLRDKAGELQVELWAWCLMGNHAHLVAKAPLEVITQFMRQVQSGYALYFNKRHNRRGKLFQGRFTSVPINDDEQLVSAVRYVHLNPVKAGESIDYPWSSYNTLANLTGTTGSPSLVLDVFGGIDGFRKSHEPNAEAAKPNLPRTRLKEEAAIELARETVAPLSLHDIKALPKTERNAKLALLKEAGLSVRQVARCTGIGHNIVARA